MLPGCVTGYSHRIHTTARRSLYRSGPRDRLFRYILNLDLKREAMRKLAALTLSLFLTSGIAFADSPKDADTAATKNQPSGKAREATKSDKSDSAIAAEIEELRQTLQSQQEQLQLLKEQLAKRDRQIDEAREAAAAANSRANEANVKATEAVTNSAAARSASAAISNAAVASSAGAPVVAQQAHDPQD